MSGPSVHGRRSVSGRLSMGVWGLPRIGRAASRGLKLRKTYKIMKTKTKRGGVLAGMLGRDTMVVRTNLSAVMIRRSEASYWCSIVSQARACVRTRRRCGHAFKARSRFCDAHIFFMGHRDRFAHDKPSVHLALRGTPPPVPRCCFCRILHRR